MKKMLKLHYRGLTGALFLFTVFWLYWLWCYTSVSHSFHWYNDIYKQRTDRSVWRRKFAYLIKPPEESVKAANLIILVTTRPQSLSRRDALRRTWIAHFQRDASVQVVFMAGMNAPITTEHNNGSLWRKVKKEARKYGDLVIVDFEDTYFNLSLKTYLAFTYALEHCPTARLILKVDDDSVLFAGNLMEYLNSTDSSEKRFYCYLYAGMRPFRNIRDQKYYVPYRLYENRHYPPYCSGHAYVGTRDAIQSVTSYAHNYLDYYLHLEDVLFTGILAKICNITHVHSSNWHPVSGPLKTIGPALSTHLVKSKKALIDQWNTYLKSSSVRLRNYLSWWLILCTVVIKLYCLVLRIGLT